MEKMANKILILSCLIMTLFMAIIFSVQPIAMAENNLTPTKEIRKLPILMYHSVLNSRKGAYIISEKQLENDLEVLQQNGYETVFASEVIAFAEGVGILPAKPVMITFDDGNFNNLFYALPILKKYKAKALFNIVGEYTEYSSVSGESSNPNYSHMTWEQIKLLKDSGFAEIGNHSFSLHHYRPRFGISKNSRETVDEYKKTLILDTMLLQEKVKWATGEFPQVYAYPFGKFSSYSEEIMRECNIKMTLTCAEKGNVVEFNNLESIRKLKRFNRNGAYKSIETILSRIN